MKFSRRADVLENVLQTIGAKHPHLVTKLWNTENYIDKILSKQDMLSIDLNYVLPLIYSFWVHHVIKLAVKTDNKEEHLD